MKLMREMTTYENKTMADFLSWIKEFQLKEWNELVDDYPCNGHEPDQSDWSVPTREHGNGKTTIVTKGHYLDNAGGDEELRILLDRNARHDDGHRLEFRLTDLIALARYGYMTLRQKEEKK